MSPSTTTAYSRNSHNANSLSIKCFLNAELNLCLRLKPLPFLCKLKNTQRSWLLSKGWRQRGGRPKCWFQRHVWPSAAAAAAAGRGSHMAPSEDQAPDPGDLLLLPRAELPPDAHQPSAAGGRHIPAAALPVLLSASPCKCVFTSKGVMMMMVVVGSGEPCELLRVLSCDERCLSLVWNLPLLTEPQCCAHRPDVDVKRWGKEWSGGGQVS